MVGEVLHRIWRENLERLERRYGLGLDLVADVACGTGLTTRYLAERGSRVLGVDGSEDMLKVAAARLKGYKRVTLLRQDMRHLSLPSKVRTVICAGDSLNHLLRGEDLRRALFSFAAALEAGGALLFDMNTEYQLREGRDEEEWRFSLEEWDFRLKSDWEEGTATAVLTMHLERRTGEGTEQWVEVHRERAYPPDQVVSLLREAGFGRVDVWDAAGLGKPGAKTRRLQFVVFKEGR